MIRVLFVCTGNICRSPTAEGVFRDMLARAGLSGHIVTDSAGTENYHVGDPPDPRSIQTAQRHGYQIGDLRARQIKASDFTEFQVILALDTGHYRALHRLCPPDFQDRIRLFLDFSAKYAGPDVPDPYYGEAKDFELVVDMAEDGAHWFTTPALSVDDPFGEG